MYDPEEEERPEKDYDAMYEDLQERRNRSATDAEYDRIADIYERNIYGD